MRRTFPSKVIGRSRLVGRYRLVVQELPPTAILRVKSEHPNSWQHAQPHAATMYCVSIASMRSRQVMGCRRRAHRHYSAGVCFCRCVAVVFGVLLRPPRRLPGRDPRLLLCYFCKEALWVVHSSLVLVICGSRLFASILDAQTLDLQVVP